MQDSAVIISKFYAPYYLKGCSGAILCTYITGHLTYLALFGNLARPETVTELALAFALLTGGYFYFFSRSWKRVTVDPAGITVDYLFLKKQKFIMYTAIIRMDTYRARTGDGNAFADAQEFVIEFYQGRLGFSEAYFENYSTLKAAVYNYKLGFNRQRSQY